jgi:hypothetical protein
MAFTVLRTLDFNSATKIINLPDGTNPQDPATVAQLNSAIEGTAWKDSVRVSTQANLNLAAPGATIDGITMVSGDRFVARSQTAGAENGIYIWNGAATPATRSLDMNVAAEVEQAVTTVEEGTNAGVSYRQTAVNVTLGTTPLAWTVFGSGAGAASETSAGIAELATQAETDAGADDLRIVTPLKLATSVFASKKFNATVGDGSATSYVITHNLGTRNVTVHVYRATGNFDEIICEIQRTTINSVTLIFDAAPTAAQFNCFIAT